MIKKNLGLANGIAAVGSGFGQFIMAPTISLAEMHLGLDGTKFLLAGVVSCSLVFGLMYSVPEMTQDYVPPLEPTLPVFCYIQYAS